MVAIEVWKSRPMVRTATLTIVASRIGMIAPSTTTARSASRAVTLDAMRRTAEEARRAAEQEPDPFRALVRYMHGAIDARAAAVIPALLSEVDFDDEEIARAREESAGAIGPLIDAAKRAGG